MPRPNRTSSPIQHQIEQFFPVSLNQQTLWIVDRLQPGTATYNITVSLRLTGKLDFQALELSLQAIVHRHGSLRTTFGVRDGAPVQIVKSMCAVSLQLRDISAFSGADLEGLAYSLAREETQKPFDLANGPLIRAVLVRLGPESHILLCIMHHIVSDGWSAELFISELAEHYSAFSAGRESCLKSLPIQYTDFAILQRHLVSDEHFKQQLAFWRRTLRGAPTLHSLPCDRMRPEQPTYTGASETLHLDNDLVVDLQRFARHQRVTFFMLLTATFQVLLSKYGKQQDILVGIPVSGRSIAETESLIGLFVNTIVLRSSLVGNPKFIDVVGRVREGLLDAMSHQDIPFDLVVDEIGARRSLNYNPIFQIMFATFRAAIQSREFGRLTARPYIIESTTSRFDLSVNIIEGFNGTWWVQAEYSTELFDRARITSMLEAYGMLLRSILTDYDQRISNLHPLHSIKTSASNAAGQTDVMVPQVSTANSGASGGAVVGATWDNQVAGSAARTRATFRFDSIECKLIDIWQKVLKISPIGLDDDFFELGGNSLLAIALVGEVNRSFDKRLPVSALFRDTTICSMAKRLRGEQVGKSSFVPLAEAGTHPPLFAAGSGREYRDLSRALGSDQAFYQINVYAVQEERLIAGRSLLTTVQDIAGHFVDQILAVQPCGPYFLAGTCEGGIVALEIARQLQRHGHRIGTLMQFDTPVRGYFSRVPLHKYLPRALHRALYQTDLSAAATVIRQKFFRLVRSKFSRLSTAHTMSTEEYIWKVIWDAVRAYGTDKTFDGAITLFRAEQPLLWYAEDVAVGWDRLGPLTIYDVPGVHGELFFTDSTTHTIIRRVLKDAQRQLLPKA